MKLLLALLTTAFLSAGAAACGYASKGAGSASHASSIAAVATAAAPETPAAVGSVNGLSTRTPGAISTRGYLNDGDHDHMGDADSDNNSDNDNDAILDYKPNDNGSYHDTDDGLVLAYGHPATADEERAVTTIVQRYYKMAAAGNGAGACSQLLPNIAKTVPFDFSRFGPSYLRGAKTCAEVMVLLFGHTHRQFVGRLRVTGVRVEGNLALALLGSRTMPASEITVARQGGGWRISELMGSPLS